MEWWETQSGGAGDADFDEAHGLISADRIFMPNAIKLKLKEAKVEDHVREVLAAL